MKNNRDNHVFDALGYTAGKWIVNEDEFSITIESSGNCDVCDVFGQDSEQRSSNAKLISNAPLMYEVLRELASMHPDGNPIQLINKARALLK